MFVDDLQWGDADSAQVMFDVLKPPETPRLLFLGTCRSEEKSESAFLNAWQKLLQCHNVSLQRREVTVSPLTQEQCLELLLARVEEDSPRIRQQAAEFYRVTEGNLFYLSDMIGCFDPASGAFRSVPLYEIIARKLTKLPPEAEHLLEVISVSQQALSLDEASVTAGHETVPMSTINHMQTEKLVRSWAVASKYWWTPTTTRCARLSCVAWTAGIVAASTADWRRRSKRGSERTA